MKSTDTVATKKNGNGLNGKSYKSEECALLAEQFTEQFNELKEKVELHHTEDTTKKIDATEKDTKDLIGKVSGIEGQLKTITIVFSLASLFFILVGTVGGFKIFQFENIKATREGTNNLLVNQVEQKTSDVINKFNITKSSDLEKTEVKNLIELANILDNLDIKDEHFQGIKKLHEVLTQVVIEENMDKAWITAKEGINKFPNDDFVLSRLKTFYAIIPIAEDRNNTYGEDKEDSLREAIKLDSTNALAQNNLGIVLANKARHIIINDVNEELVVSEQQFNEMINLIKEANLHFEVASLLNPSSIGKLKYVNNKTWCDLIKLRYILNTEGIESPKIAKFLQENNYTNIQEFFKDSSIPIELYEASTNFPNPPETLAQILWLQAEYMRKSKTHSEEDITKLENAGAKKFEEAIKRKIHNRVKTKEEASKQFEEDYLHQYIKKQRPDLFQTLKTKIIAN